MGTVEQWKEVKGFDLYEVSNLGRVRSKNMVSRNGSGDYVKRGRILRAFDNGSGYLKLHIGKGKDKKGVYVHRLVAEAFIPNPESKPFVNHIDNDPSNNNSENLEWVTHQENMDWMNAQGRATRTKEWLDHLHEAQVEQYTAVVGTCIETGEKLFFEKLNGVSERGFQPSCVSCCINGKAKQHKGYRWARWNQ